MRGDAPQLVELGVVARRDHIAVAQHHRGLLGDRTLQEIGDVGVLAHRGRQIDDQRRLDAAQGGAQRGQRRDRSAQGGEIARPRAAQRHARQNALHVADGAQRLAQALEAARVDQQRDAPGSGGAVPAGR